MSKSDCCPICSGHVDIPFTSRIATAVRPLYELPRLIDEFSAVELAAAPALTVLPDEQQSS
jgi:hypothetical protein